MKGKTIIGLALALGLLLIGSLAYAHWNDYGDRGYYGTDYRYGCGYGHAYRTGYDTNVNAPAVRAHIPCYGYGHRGDWRTYDNRHNYGNNWTGHRGYRMGPRECW